MSVRRVEMENICSEQREGGCKGGNGCVNCSFLTTKGCGPPEWEVGCCQG